MIVFFFFFNDTATTEIYTLSLHDALPIYVFTTTRFEGNPLAVFTDGDGLSDNAMQAIAREMNLSEDRKSTRLNSSHVRISYAVFCLKKKKHLIHVYRIAAVVR